MMTMFSRRTDWKLATNRFTVAQQEFQREGREILDLTVSNPTRAGIEYDESTILDSLKNPKSLDYDPQPKGLVSARQAVAEYYRCGSDTLFRQDRTESQVPRPAQSPNPTATQVDPESILLTTSTSEGYSYVFRLLCNPGDEVLVPKPSYPLFEFLADLHDVTLVSYPLLYDHGWQIDWPSLENAATEKTRALLLVNPNNPTGSYVSAEDRLRLNQLCRDRHLALIVDEVFLDYAHDAHARPSFAINEAALTFTLSGLSKISALPQMKLAWIVVSGPQNEVTVALPKLEIIADTYLSLNAPVQLATRVLLEQRKKIQPQLMRRVLANLADLDRQLSRQQTCNRLAVEGGWYAVLRVPVMRSDEDLAIELLMQQSVLVHPGHFYDFPSDGYLVLSLITPEPVFRDGMARVLNFVEG